MTPFGLENLARVGAGAIVDSLLLGSLVAALAWGVLAMLRNHRAAIRFLVVAVALVCSAVLPALRPLGGSASGASPLLQLGQSFALAIAGVWALGAAVGLARVAIGLINIQRLRHRCRHVTLPAELQQAVAQFCPARRVELLAGDAVSVPSAIGFFRPAVILPPWLLEELSSAEIRQVLIHELSHLRRRDDWTNLLQRIIKALFFFHPAVWWMESRLSLEREMACDDAVLAESSSARDYAECLARVAEKSLVRRGLAMAQAAVSRMRQTTRRVARILQADRAARGGKFAVSVATVFALTGFGALLQAPTLVSFSSPPDVALASTRPSADVALASSRKSDSVAPASGRHLAGSPRAVNAKLSSRVPPRSADLQSVKTVWRPRSLSQPEERSLQATQSKPAVHAVQARMTTNSVRGTTLVFVTQDQNTITVWRITTWVFVPSQQVSADHKTT